MKKTISLLFSIFLLFTACKPTEKGYKSAYDAAQGKRKATMDYIDANIPQSAIQEFDGAELKEIDGVSVYVMSRYLKPAEMVMEAPHKYNVAIGKYKMITNCKAQAESLLADGYHAFSAKDNEGVYYTIAGSFPTLKEAVAFYQKYRDGKDHVYVGLPNSPVIIYSPK